MDWDGYIDLKNKKKNAHLPKISNIMYVSAN